MVKTNNAINFRHVERIVFVSNAVGHIQVAGNDIPPVRHAIVIAVLYGVNSAGPCAYEYHAVISQGQAAGIRQIIGKNRQGEARGRMQLLYNVLMAVLQRKD